ncbi:MAG TPA: enoyl-CoA hydratase, partial [Mycobacterium sp.]|nr:enoyl-CoA hydratase [Mycobacterium sp.]
SFLMLSGDHLIGAPTHRIQANEVAIGLTMPGPALAILRHRLTPAAFQRAVGLAAEFKGESAVVAGYLDELVEADMVRPRAHEVAKGFTSLDPRAHKESKLKARAAVLDQIRTTIAAEFPSAK